MRNTLTKATEAHLRGHIEKHKANIELLLSNPVGVAEHPDLMETIELELNQLAEYHDKLEMLNTYF